MNPLHATAEHLVEVLGGGSLSEAHFADQTLGDRTLRQDGYELDLRECRLDLRCGVVVAPQVD
tara:strand:+ start:93 stop:281 length:189 start_codon:yes stop_codon:yes gene_type:complete